MDKKLEKVIKELKKLIELGELQKQTNAQLENQLKELKNEKCCNKESIFDDDKLERKEKIAILQAQLELRDDMLKKMKELEDEKDQLIRKLETLFTENEELVIRNKELEERITFLENECKHEFQNQPNQGILKIPVPVPIDKKTQMLRSLRIAEKIEEISEKKLEVSRRQSEFSQDFSRTILRNQRTLASFHVVDSSSKVNEDHRSSENSDKLSEELEVHDQDEEAEEADFNVPGSSFVLTSTNPARVYNKIRDSSLLRLSLEANFLSSTGILRKPTVYLEPQIDDTYERAKNLLMDQVEPDADKKLLQKRVRLSMAASTHSSERHNSELENQNEESLNRSENKNETFANFLVRRTSTRTSSSLTSNDSRINRIPNILLDNLSDKRHLLKYSENAIEIEIVSLELAQNSSLLNAEDHRFLYIEYSFLGYKGHLLETQSLPRPRKQGEVVFYRFSQKFEVSLDDNEKHLRILKSMVEKNSKYPIKFCVVSEPINSNDDDVDGECEEIGFAFIKLHEVINKSSNNSETLDADVFSTSYPNDLIAILNIKISGLSLLRKLSKEKNIY